MNKYHDEIIQLLQNQAGHSPIKSEYTKNYLGHNETSYNLSSPQMQAMIKDWYKEHKDLSFGEFVDLLDSLYSQAETSSEKECAGYLIRISPKFRAKIPPKKIDYWLNYLNGWAQIDSLCQPNFTYEDLLGNWKDWKSFLLRFNKSEDISKRRASLVLLTKPMRGVYDERLLKIAIPNIESLKHEKDILITKAISWLLRDMVKYYREDVIEYLKKNEKTLPAIAVRETKRKIETGRK